MASTRLLKNLTFIFINYYLHLTSNQKTRFENYNIILVAFISSIITLLPCPVWCNIPIFAINELQIIQNNYLHPGLVLILFYTKISDIHYIYILFIWACQYKNKLANSTISIICPSPAMSHRYSLVQQICNCTRNHHISQQDTKNTNIKKY